VSEEGKPRVSLRVVNYIDGEKLKEDVAYSEADLNTAFQQQSSLFVHYATLHAKAERQVDDLKLTLEAAESKVYRNLRDAATEKSEKVTEAQLEKMVAGTDFIIQMKKLINEAKQVAAIAKGAVEGFKQRRDMLIQSGADQREEMKGELRIAAREAREDTLERQKERVLKGLAGTA
jgi:hypothetical protein